MANTFGAQQLFDPRHARKYRRRWDRSIIPELEYANSLYVPAGRYPAVGWILLTRAALNAINKYSTTMSLVIDEFDKAAPSLTFQNLAIVQARCVTRGIVSDANAIYLVEITDGRGLIANRWFEYPLNQQYNVRAPAYAPIGNAAATFYLNSLNTGSVWTWDTMANNIWTKMGAFLGTYPGLPIVPAGTPENWIFPGMCCFDALMSILTHLGLTIAVDLTQASPYTIVQKGAADATFASTQATFAGRLDDDFEWVDVGAGRVPGVVIVYFHRRNQYYGTEETIRNDGLQWATTPAYSVMVSAPAQFAGATGTHYIWDDFQIRYDIDSIPVAADIATAGTIAFERATQYFNDIYWSTLGYMRSLYTGIIPFACGSQVDGVCWRQSFEPGFERKGWITEIVRGESPPWPHVGRRGHHERAY